MGEKYQKTVSQKFENYTIKQIWNDLQFYMTQRGCVA